MTSKRRKSGAPGGSSGPDGAGVKAEALPEEAPEVLVGAREGLAVLALLALFVCVAFGNVVFSGKSLVATDNHNPFSEVVNAETAGEGFVPESVWSNRGLIIDPNFHDIGATWWQWEPGPIFLRNGFEQDGELGFWDPYVAAGTPFIANLTATPFFPPYLVVIILGATPFLKNAYFLSMLVGAGFFTYLVLRKHGMPLDASFFGATAFLFSGALIQNVNTFLGQTTACLPFSLFLVRRFLDRATWKRSASLGVGYAAIALSSFPPILSALFGFNVLYVAVCLAAGCGRDRSRWPLVLARFGTAVAASVGLVAFYYVPAFALNVEVPQVRAAYEHAGLVTIPPASLFQLLSPDLAGGKPIYVRPAFRNPSGLTLWYAGIATALFACFAGRSGERKRDQLLLASAVAMALVVLKLVGALPIQWISTLPVFKNVHFIYFGLLLNFCLVILAASGFSQIVEGKVTWERATFVFFAACLALGSLQQIAVDQGVLGEPDARRWLLHFWAASALALGLAVAIAAFLLLRRRRLARASFALAVLLLAAGEGVAYAAYPRQQGWDVWRHPVAYLRAIKERTRFGRVLPFSRPIANVNSAFEIFSLDSLMAFNPPRIFEFYRTHFCPTTEFFLRGITQLPSEAVLDAASIELIPVEIASPERIRLLQERGYPVVFDDGYIRIHMRRSRPRYFFTSRYRVVAERDAEKELGKADVGGPLLVERTLSFESTPDLPGDSVVEVKEFRRNGYRLALHAPRPGLVYMSESYFAGWSAKVNGQRAEILAANHAFRAVEVAAGDVVIEMSYRPPGLPAGLLVSGAAFFLILVLRRRAD